MTGTGTRDRLAASLEIPPVLSVKLLSSCLYASLGPSLSLPSVFSRSYKQIRLFFFVSIAVTNITRSPSSSWTPSALLGLELGHDGSLDFSPQDEFFQFSALGFCMFFLPGPLFYPFERCSWMNTKVPIYFQSSPFVRPSAPRPPPLISVCLNKPFSCI